MESLWRYEVDDSLRTHEKLPRVSPEVFPLNGPFAFLRCKSDVFWNGSLFDNVRWFPSCSWKVTKSFPRSVPVKWSICFSAMWIRCVLKWCAFRQRGWFPLEDGWAKTLMVWRFLKYPPLMSSIKFQVCSILSVFWRTQAPDQIHRLVQLHRNEFGYLRCFPCLVSS